MSLQDIAKDWKRQSVRLSIIGKEDIKAIGGAIH